MISEKIDISVVIGFKDWGVERLLLSIGSILDSFGEKRGEVIVSDFGSDAFVPGELQELIESSGGVYVRTETDGTWSRSRAVNAGYSAARGSVVVATDADMLFTPKSMEIVANEVLTDPSTAVVLQCRDLPEGYDHTRISEKGLNFDELHRVSQIRPRWGMGGMFAAHRDAIAAVGGYDNRMHTYGGEDLDLAVRIRRSGHRVRWIENDDVRMYHIWHEPTIKSVEEDEAAKKAVAANRAILRTDQTWKRNVENGEFAELRIPWARDAVSVVGPEGPILEGTSAAFKLITPVEIGKRDDLSALIARRLNTTTRAVVGQVVAFEPPKNRTSPNWEIEYRLPVLAFDSRLAPLVDPYFSNGRWDILGASRRLQAAGVATGVSSEIFGIIPKTPGNSRMARSHEWEWDSAKDIFPKKPGPWATSDLIKNLSIDFIAKIAPAIDIRVFSRLVKHVDDIKPVTRLASEWCLSRNLLSGSIEFEAILLNVSEDELTALHNFESLADADLSQIQFGEALGEIERISKSNSLVSVAENIRQNRENETGALEVSWIENPQAIDEEVLDEVRNIGGDLVDVQNHDFHARMWLAPAPVMDKEGNIISSLHRSRHFEDWNTGLLGPIPVEALVALVGRL